MAHRSIQNQIENEPIISIIAVQSVHEAGNLICTALFTCLVAFSNFMVLPLSAVNPRMEIHTSIPVALEVRHL